LAKGSDQTNIITGDEGALPNPEMNIQIRKTLDALLQHLVLETKRLIALVILAGF
jgi:hypothetical protein